MKYIFFDIDSTLVSHVNTSHIPPETRTAINLLQHSGHVPAIATGRGAFLASSVAHEFGINYMVCSGGAQIFADGHEIYTLWLPDGVLEKFYGIAQRFPELTAAIDKQYLYASEAFSSFREYFNSQAGYDCMRPLAEMNSAIICYIMLPPGKITREHGMFYSPPEGVRLELMRDFVEARHENSSKWHGIETLIKSLNASLDDVIVFGDGPNDVEMIKRAKIGVAVGRSAQVARDAADYICEDIDDGGILKACKYLGLI